MPPPTTGPPRLHSHNPRFRHLRQPQQSRRGHMSRPGSRAASLVNRNAPLALPPSQSTRNPSALRVQKNYCIRGRFPRRRARKSVCDNVLGKVHENSRTSPSEIQVQVQVQFRVQWKSPAEETSPGGPYSSNEIERERLDKRYSRTSVLGEQDDIQML
jgi:hypothetical protein